MGALFTGAHKGCHGSVVLKMLTVLMAKQILSFVQIVSRERERERESVCVCVCVGPFSFPILIHVLATWQVFWCPLVFSSPVGAMSSPPNPPPVLCPQVVHDSRGTQRVLEEDPVHCG